MLRNRYLCSAALVGVATAAIASSIATLQLNEPKTTARNLDGYSFQEPVGGADAVPTIFVVSDNKTSYSRVGFNDKRLRFNIRYSRDCTGNYTAFAPPHVIIGDQIWPKDDSWKQHGIPPEGIVHATAINVLRENLKLDAKADPVRRCNTVVTDYTLQGKLPAKLLSQGFWVRVDNVAPARLNPQCAVKNGPIASIREFILPVWINCMPTGYTAGHRLPPEPHRTKPEAHRLPGVFRSIDLAAVNSPLKHLCPATVVFKGKFQANRAVKGKYRLIGSGGYSSPSYPFSLAENGERSVSWQRRVELPAATGGLASPGAGTWPRSVTGWLQLEVTASEASAQPQRSGQAAYRVDCLKPPSPGDTLRSGG